MPRHEAPAALVGFTCCYRMPMEILIPLRSRIATAIAADVHRWLPGGNAPHVCRSPHWQMAAVQMDTWRECIWSTVNARRQFSLAVKKQSVLYVFFTKWSLLLFQNRQKVLPMVDWNSQTFVPTKSNKKLKQFFVQRKGCSGQFAIWDANFQRCLQIKHDHGFTPAFAWRSGLMKNFMPVPRPDGA